ncbi:HTH-type transcriptional regulator McbR [Pseudoclavibacter triregionum]|nr:HTH-type transcriptional regulator McbR [Pseudoclavibacter triregionum]
MSDELAIGGASEAAEAQSAEPQASKAQRAREFIRGRIADGTYTPGTRLVLGQIARELGMSPVPVREAVRMLEAEGSVSYAHNIGAQVAVLDADVYVDTMQTLALVEGYATALSAPHLTPEDLEEAREANEELGRALADFDPAAFTRANQRFHRILAGRCPNSHILDLCERGWARMQTLRETSLGFVPGRASTAHAEHVAILELIESAASQEEVERAARKHRLDTLEAFLTRMAETAPAGAIPPEAAPSPQDPQHP